MAAAMHDLEGQPEHPVLPLALARRLGWLGLGLGACMVLAPRSFARRASLAATAALAGLTSLDLLRGTPEYRARTGEAGRGRVRQARVSIRINREPQVLYRFWRELENLPRFMHSVEAVKPVDDGRSHWRAIGPGGTSIEWMGDTLVNEPDRRIEWGSLPGSPILHCGTVRFQPGRGGRGTLVQLELQLDWHRTRAAGEARPAPLQATHGDRRDRNDGRPAVGTCTQDRSHSVGVIMRANCWYGKHDLRVQEVPDPRILNPRDAIVKVTLTAVCGSDLHLYNGVIPRHASRRYPGP
jgi:uncharacterized membrane protein